MSKKVRLSVEYDVERKSFIVVHLPEDGDNVWGDEIGDWYTDVELTADAEHALDYELKWNEKAHEFLRLYYRGPRDDADDKRFEILRTELDTVL